MPVQNTDGRRQSQDCEIPTSSRRDANTPSVVEAVSSANSDCPDGGGVHRGDIVIDLVERCESAVVHVTRTTFVPPQLAARDAKQTDPVDVLISLIAGGRPPSAGLVRGLREQVGRLRVAVHHDELSLLLTDLKSRARQVSDAAICLQDFPKNGDVDKKNAAWANSAAKTLKRLLSNDLLSYIFNDEPFVIDLLLADALDAICDRTHWALSAANGRPKKLTAFDLPGWEMLVPHLKDLGDRADDASKRPNIKKRMRTGEEYLEAIVRVSLPSSVSDLLVAESNIKLVEKAQINQDKKKHDPNEQRYSAELHCAIVVGVAFAVASSSPNELAFPGIADEACDTLWQSIGGEAHESNSKSGNSYWRGIIRDAKKPACAGLLHLIKYSFR
jgi:hypothetical protein